MQRKNHYDALISGMGPAGLAAAYEAAKRGKKVALVEKRDGKFTRVQRVFIGYFERQYLVSMLLGSPPDQKKLPDPEGYLMLRAIGKEKRKALFRALRAMSKEELDQLQKTENANALMEQIGIPADKRPQLGKMLLRNPDRIIRNYQDLKLINMALNPFNPQAAAAQIPLNHIERYIKHRIDDINDKYAQPLVEFMTHSTVTALQGERVKSAVVTTSHGEETNQREISFDFLVGADGYTHALADRVNEVLKVENQIKYAEIPRSDLKKNDHIFIHFNLSLPSRTSLYRDYAIIRLAPAEQPNDPCLCFLSFDRHSAESSGYRSVKCVLTSEIVDCLQPDESNHQPAKELLEFTRRALVESNAVPRTMKMDIQILDDARKPDRLKFSSFSTRGSLQASKPWAAVGDGQTFLLTGDAFRHPDYQRSHGTGDALNQAQWLGDVFARKMTPQEYEVKCRTRHEGLARYYEPREASPATFPGRLTDETDSLLTAIKNPRK